VPIGWCEYPRSALPESHWKALYEANTILIDEVLEDLTDLRAGTGFEHLGIADYLPPRYLTRYDDEFLRRFLMCLTSVGLKLRLPGFHPLGCVAEELALHAMIERARELLEEDGEEDDYSAWEDYAFEDADFELLYDDVMDGIEESPVGRRLGMAPMGFHDWFVPFSPPRVVHPYVDAGDVPPWDADRDEYADGRGASDGEADEAER